jgi:hypothetical protein
MMENQTKLENALQTCLLQADELETKDNQMAQIMDMVDDYIQRQEDAFINTHNASKKKIAFYTVKAMRELKKEIEIIQGQEG